MFTALVQILSRLSGRQVLLVAIAWLALAPILGFRFAPYTKTWTLSAPDGTDEIHGVAYSPRTKVLIALVTVVPPVLLVTAWWFRHR